MPDSTPNSASEAAALPDQATRIAVEGSAEARLLSLLDRYLEELQQGLEPDRVRLLAENPDLAVQLEACLSGMDFIHRTSQKTDVPARLGDFRIVREIGRGGMGVVFEAEQVSLRRRVALKVLRFGGAADPQAMQRFQREAETVAELHHTNIVPIFAIGEENGVHYYAMQFIEGESLAAIGPGTLDAREVARMGLQAAEALAHAHQRGVIHRDIKPSNLIRDRDGRIWLTDFGLAKRIDDVTLSIAGSILGTPRYMSPEQASATVRPVDHRTDVYSLGATLYELATGRPVFQADSPHAVISQILTTEPMAPRTARPGLPRDLETILVKCLSKDPLRRYQSAQSLADDLRAFLDGRAIKARRTTLLEHAGRWLKKQKSSAVVAAAAALIAVGLVAGLTFWMNAARQARMGSLKLTTATPPLRAEVLAEGVPVVPSFTLPTEHPLPIEEGEYDLRLSKSGQFSETLVLDIRRASEKSTSIRLQDRTTGPLLTTLSGRGQSPSDPFRGYIPVKFGDRTDLIVPVPDLQQPSIVRINGETRQAVWEASWKKDGPALKDFLPDFTTQETWQAFLWEWGGHQLWRVPSLMLPLPDVNADGTGDLVWCGAQTSIMAVQSGADGKLLWWRSLSERPAQLQISSIVGSPVSYTGKDGSSLLIALVASGQDRGLEAVEGRTGRQLWKHDLSESNPDGSAPKLPDPLKLAVVNGRTLVLCPGAKGLVGCDPATGTRVFRHDYGFVPRQQTTWADVDGDRTPELICVANPLDDPQVKWNGLPRIPLVAISAATGKRTWTFPVESTWVNSVTAGMSSSLGAAFEPPHWPVVVDLNLDGRDEVVMPWQIRSGQRSEVGWSVIDGAGAVVWRRTLPNQSSGRGQYLCIPEKSRFAAGPDLDGDGRRELFAITAWTERTEPSAFENRQQSEAVFFVEACSGRDGHSLWLSRILLPGPVVHVNRPLWRQVRKGDHPALVVETTCSRPSSNYAGQFTYVIASEDGRLMERGEDLGFVKAVDLDRDGCDELLALAFERPEYTDSKAQLQVFRGADQDVWRRLSRTACPAGDLDGDCVVDLIQQQVRAVDNVAFQTGSRAISGRTGRSLWTNPIPWDDFQCSRPVTTVGDLDRDGVPDLLVLPHTDSHSIAETGLTLTRGCVSGRTGKTLWKQTDATIPAVISAASPSYLNVVPASVNTLDLDGDGSLEAICAYQMTWSSPGVLSRGGLAVLVCLSTRDGGLRWISPIGARPNPNPISFIPYLRCAVAGDVADMNGDKVRDLFVTALQDTPDYVAAAVDGATGKLLWERTVECDSAYRQPSAVEQLSWNLPAPALADLNGDGRPELFVQNYLDRPDPKAPEGQRRFISLIARGVDGRELWRWEKPVPAGSGRYIGAQEQRHAIPRPIPVQLADGKRGLVTWTWGNPGEVIWLSAAGQVLQTFPVTRQPTYDRPGDVFRIWTADLDRKPGDEVLVNSQDDLLAVPSPGSRAAEATIVPLWRHPRGDVLGILDHEGGKTIAIRSGNVVGLNGRTGARLWSCAEPRDNLVHTSSMAMDTFGPPDAPQFLHRTGVPPLIVFGRTTDAPICREPLPVEEIKPAPLTYSPINDPRLTRRLPWATGASTGPGMILEVGVAFGSLALAALGVILLPMGLMIQAWRSNVGPLVRLVILTAAILILMTSTLLLRAYLNLGHVGWPAAILAMPLGGLPLWAYAAALAGCIVPNPRTRWLVLSLGPLGFSTFIGGMMLWSDSAGAGSMQYVPDGWYLILFLGIYATGLLLVAWASIRLAVFLYRTGLRHFGRQPAGGAA